MQDDSTTRRVWTVSDPTITATPKPSPKAKKAPPPPPRIKDEVEVYNPYSTQMKGKRSGWRGRMRRNAKQSKKARKNHNRLTPAPPTGKYTIDPYYDSVPWRNLREATLTRDDRTCQYCGDVAHQADHVIPRKQGGPDALTNLVACCHICNKTAGGRRFKDFTAKKQWVLANREDTKVERREIPPDMTYLGKVVYSAKMTPLRARLAKKHQSPNYVESVLRNKT